jgi:hypothetical protein
MHQPRSELVSFYLSITWRHDCARELYRRSRIGNALSGRSINLNAHIADLQRADLVAEMLVIDVEREVLRTLELSGEAIVDRGVLAR